MGKTYKEDPYKGIRRLVPPPGYTIIPKTDYNKNEEKNIIEEGIEDYFYGEDEEDLRPYWEYEVNV